MSDVTWKCWEEMGYVVSCWPPNEKTPVSAERLEEIIDRHKAKSRGDIQSGDTVLVFCMVSYRLAKVAERIDPDGGSSFMGDDGSNLYPLSFEEGRGWVNTGAFNKKCLHLKLFHSPTKEEA